MIEYTHEIKVYYADRLPDPKFDDSGQPANLDERQLIYKNVWYGGNSLLDFEFTDDMAALELVFESLQLETPAPDGFDGERALSTGDVVCIEDRCYICQPFGWRQLEHFWPNETISKNWLLMRLNRETGSVPIFAQVGLQKFPIHDVWFDEQENHFVINVKTGADIEQGQSFITVEPEDKTLDQQNFDEE